MNYELRKYKKNMLRIVLIKVFDSAQTDVIDWNFVVVMLSLACTELLSKYRNMWVSLRKLFYTSSGSVQAKLRVTAALRLRSD